MGFHWTEYFPMERGLFAAHEMTRITGNDPSAGKMVLIESYPLRKGYKSAARFTEKNGTEQKAPAGNKMKTNFEYPAAPFTPGPGNAFNSVIKNETDLVILRMMATGKFTLYFLKLVNHSFEILFFV